MTCRRIEILELRSVRGTGGGPEKTILSGATRINRERFVVTVCYIRDLRDQVFHVDARAENLGIDYMEVRERHSFDWRIWRTLTSLVRDRAIDIVHGHDYKTDLLAFLLARRCGVVPLSTAHGWTGQTRRERYIYYPAHKRLLARFPRVIAVSSDIKNALVRRGARPDRITVLLNAIDSLAFQRVPARRDGIRRTLGFDSTAFVIGAVGRVERQKRFDLLLAAFAGVASRHRHARLVIAGAGGLEGELRSQAAALRIADRCLFLGHRADVADLHHAFDLFVQSSEYEGTPNAVLEAMAMETPIVATDVGGTRELIPSDAQAIVVPAHDIPALANAIERALADPDSGHIRAQAARRRVETELSFEARTGRLEAIYEDCMAGRRQNSIAIVGVRA